MALVLCMNTPSPAAANGCCLLLLLLLLEQVYVYRGHKALELAALDGKEDISPELAQQVSNLVLAANSILHSSGT